MSQTCASFRVRVQSLRAKQILQKENLARAVFTGVGVRGEVGGKEEGRPWVMGGVWRSGGISGEEGQRGNEVGEKDGERDQHCPWTGAGTTGWGVSLTWWWLRMSVFFALEQRDKRWMDGWMGPRERQKG